MHALVPHIAKSLLVTVLSAYQKLSTLAQRLLFPRVPTFPFHALSDQTKTSRLRPSSVSDPAGDSRTGRVR